MGRPKGSKNKSADVVDAIIPEVLEQKIRRTPMKKKGKKGPKNPAS